MTTAIIFLFQFAILAYALVSGVFRWIFMVLFIGLAPVSLFVAGYGGWVLGGHPGTLMLFAGIIYLVGCFGVTVFFNVPMNEALAGMDAQIDATRAYWEESYLPRWTFWNSVRTVACAVSAALGLFALLWANQLHLA